MRRTVFQLALQLQDLLLQHAAVGLDLGFARAAEKTAAAALTFEVGPAADQPALLVFEMRKFDLKRALLGAGACGRRFRGSTPVRSSTLAFSAVSEIALLHRRQRMVDDDQLRFLVLHDVGEFVDFARPRAVSPDAGRRW